MTHFIGAVIVPADVHTDFVRTPTAFPDLYGKNALETDPTETLSAYLAKALAPFDESREVEYYKSKADIIAEKRAEIEAFEQGTYAQYLKNPEEYRRDILSSPVPNLRHLEYLEKEFPKQLKWSDEEVYQGALKFEEASNVRQSDGAVRQTYNPLSKWDWWTIGGRWEEMYRERQGQKVSELLPIVEQELADVRDPANIAELAEVMEYIETVRQQFREQQKRTQAWYAENPDKRSNDVDENFRLANSGVVEKVITYQDLDAAEAKKHDCKGYLPWWFPFHLVTPKLVDFINDDGEAVYDSEGNPEKVQDFDWHQQGRVGWFGFKSDEMSDEAWVEKLIELLKAQDPDARLVYIDFHI